MSVPRNVEPGRSPEFVEEKHKLDVSIHCKRSWRQALIVDV